MSKNGKEAEKAALARNVRINCSLKPLTTAKKISMTSGEDTTSLLLSSLDKDVMAVPGHPITSLTQHRSSKKKVLYYPESDNIDDKVPEDKRSYEAWCRPRLNEDSEDFNRRIDNPDNSMIKVLLCIDRADQAAARNSKRSQNDVADEKPRKKVAAARAVSFSPNFDYYSEDFDGNPVRLATNKRSLKESILAEDEPLLLDKKEEKNGIASVHHLPSKVFKPNKWYLERPYPGTQEDPSVEEAIEKSKLASHIPPVNWYDKSKYNSDVVKIFTAWIEVDETLRQMKDRALNRLFVNPPVLPWYLPEGIDFIALVMNYVRRHESNAYSNGGNSANYVQSNGHLTAACWGLPRVLLGNDTFFTSL
jgi:hypothetical protein